MSVAGSTMTVRVDEGECQFLTDSGLAGLGKQNLVADNRYSIAPWLLSIPIHVDGHGVRVTSVRQLVSPE